jgi:hypothetical protein
MMIGVAHVMGMNPILRSFFSGGPSLTWASALAAWRGKDVGEGGGGSSRADDLEEIAAVPEDRVLDRALDEAIDHRLGVLGFCLHRFPPPPVRRSIWDRIARPEQSKACASTSLQANQRVHEGGENQRRGIAHEISKHAATVSKPWAISLPTMWA